MTPLQEWLVSALLAFGGLIAGIGLALLLVPGRILGASATLNRWISTEGFFNNLDRARPTERNLYRHHRVLGIFIVLGSLFILYVFIFKLRLELLTGAVPLLKSKVISEWVYSSLIYLFEIAASITLLIGLVVAVRPSLLKKLEEWSNHWVETGSTFRGLDRRHEIPENIFPGNVRLFGVAVLLGGIYIMLSAGVALLR